jgi:hypothetical protein
VKFLNAATSVRLKKSVRPGVSVTIVTLQQVGEPADMIHDFLQAQHVQEDCP